MPSDTKKTPYLVEKHGDGKKNVSKPGISIINCISMRKKHFGDQNFVSGNLFTGASRHKATWEKFILEHWSSWLFQQLEAQFFSQNSHCELKEK